MTTYYVRKSGSDGNNGTSPATAWLTISKALGASGISSGDTAYIGPGVYRESITVDMVSATSETFVIGDVLGANTGDDPGEVRITNYMTDDTTAPTDQDFIDLHGRDYLTFQNIIFSGAYPIDTGYTVFRSGEANASINITIKDCVFYIVGNIGYGSQIVKFQSGVPGVPLNLTIDRCYFFIINGINAISILLTKVDSADYDANVLIRNNVFISDTTVVAVASSGLGSFKGGGIRIYNNTSINGNIYGGVPNDLSTTYPVEIKGNLSIGCNGTETDFTTFPDVVEDYNVFVTDAVTKSGVNSIAGYDYHPAIHFGQENVLGFRARHYATPTLGSPLIGFGNFTGSPSADILNRPRPAGGQATVNAVGAYELHDTGIEDTSTYDSAPASVKIIGPGDQDFELAVDAVATNISIMVQYDANHGETNKPQVQLLANPLIGVSAETKTMTEVADVWEKLEFTQFTPTARGVVTLRCISRAAVGNGQAWFDSITV